MRSTKTVFLSLLCLLVMATISHAATVSMKLSGPGAVNDSTIKAGEKVSFDVYIENDATRLGFTLGFKMTSDDIKKVVHVADSGNGLNELGDLKGHNGFHDASIWDIFGVMAVESDWDGVLPDTVGFGGLATKAGYAAGKMEKKLSWECVVPEAGTLVVDSCFFPPGGKWLFSSPADIADSAYTPGWLGPYKFKVVK